PVYPSLPAQQIEYILENAGVQAVFVSTAEQLAKVREVRMQLPALAHVIVFDEVSPADDHTTFAQLLAVGKAEDVAGRGSDFRTEALRARPDDLATILYTS